MALRSLQKADLNKRKNHELIVQRTFSGKHHLTNGMIVGGAKEIKLNGTTIRLTQLNLGQVADSIRHRAADNLPIRPGDLEVKVDSGKFVRLSEIHKDNEYTGQKKRASGSDGRKDQERQERGLISIINQLTLDGPLPIPGLGKISRAEKVEGKNAFGKEPYSDICLYEVTGKKILVSCKDENPPSIGGGGLIGLQNLAPKLMDDFYKELEVEMSKRGFKQGDVFHYKQVPDFFGKIGDHYKRDLFIGNAAMGGPVSHMYVGKMDVVYDGSKFNGKFIQAKAYIDKYDFFIRLRKRDVEALGGMIKIDFKKKTKSGHPVVFVDPKHGKAMSRVLLEKKTYDGVVFDLN